MPGAGQRRPKGTFKTATIAWKLRVRERLDEIPMTRTELAKAVNVSTAAITQLLGREDEQPKKTSSTKLKPSIHEALGWPAPTDDADEEPPRDPLQAKFLRAWPHLDDTERQLIELIVERHKKKT